MFLSDHPFDRPRVLDLVDGELLRCGRPARLHVLAGRVWLTRAHDSGDHFLLAGDDALLNPVTFDLAGAEGATRVALVPVGAPAPWRRAAAGTRRMARAALTMAFRLLRARAPRRPWTSPPTSSP